MEEGKGHRTQGKHIFTVKAPGEKQAEEIADWICDANGKIKKVLI